MHSMRLLSVVMVLALAVSVCFGGGWQLNEHGARAMGFGGAWAARALDLSTMYTNAAGLTNMKGINVMVGGTMILPSSKFKGPGSATTETSMESQTFLLPNLYGSYQINDKLFVGLAVFAPFGLGTEWPEAWVGRRLAVKTELQTIYINPTVAYLVNEKLSVGAGVSFILGNVAIRYRVPTYSSLTPPTPATNDGTASLEADASMGVAFNVGVLYKFNDKLSVGASYRTLAEVDFEGDATFSNMQALTSFFPGGAGSTMLPMPSNLQVGVAYQVMPKLSVEGDFQYVGWSAYEKLDVKITNGPVFPLTGQPLQTSQSATQGWDDGYFLRIGAEYVLNSKWMVRAGLIKDFTGQPKDKMEPRLPDWDKTDLTLGASYQVNEKIAVDVAYMMILSTERGSSYPGFTGIYTSSANLFAVDVSYAF